jgi:NADH-quinone oxidoreductase subunit K
MLEKNFKNLYRRRLLSDDLCFTKSIMIQNTLDIPNMLNYLTLSATLLILGVFGVFLTRRHLILILISIELILLSVNLNFVVFSVYLDDIVGQVFSLFVLMVAAAESSIGLAILVVYYRLFGTISVDFINLLKS